MRLKAPKRAGLGGQKWFSLLGEISPTISTQAEAELGLLSGIFFPVRSHPKVKGGKESLEWGSASLLGSGCAKPGLHLQDTV